jgi:glyoxylase-like metal-dependent hydrolase (beta-lactamase superfamily II)
MKINVHTFTFNPFQENTYVLVDTIGNCVIIDPGCYERFEQQELSHFIQENGLTVKALLSTHSHVDHVLGNSYVHRTYKVDHYAHELDVQTLHSVESYAFLYGFQGYEPSPDPTKLLKGGEILEFGDIRLKVLFTPGHAPGHVVYYNEENNFVINGDVLFSGSFGRVDLPGGSLEVLKQSIHEIMFRLPEETVVHCGHGPATTIGKEKRSNYILNF